VIQLVVLGPLRLTAGDGHEVHRLLHRPKRVALLAYLATASPRGFHRRDRLLALFWPELDAKRARAALNQAIYVLRSVLGEAAIITRGDEEVAVSSEAIACDTHVFENALSAGALEEAVAVYHGDFLDGFFLSDAPEFEQWADRERDRLRHVVADACCSLAEQHATNGNTRAAMRAARRAMVVLPADERVLRRVMLVFHRLGDRAAALRAYEAFAWELSRDLDAQPSAETTKLATDIRREGNTVDGSSELPRMDHVRARSRFRSAWLWGAAAGAAAVAVTAAGFTSVRPAPIVPPVVRYALDVSRSTPLVTTVAGPSLALSPDGTVLAYLGTGERGPQLFSRSLEQLESVPLPHTDGARFPFFSPDAKWIGFEIEGALRRVPVTGGPAITIYRSAKHINGVSWGAGDRIVFASEGALWEISATGHSQPRLVAAADTARGELLRWPEILPDGRTVLFTTTHASSSRISVVRLPNGPVKKLDIEGSNPHFVAPGHIVFARADGALLTTAFDLRSLETGPVLPITDGVLVGVAGAAKVAVAPSGAIAYLRPATERVLAMADRNGRVERMKAPVREFYGVRFSRDGQRLSTTIGRDGEANTRLWIYHIGTSDLLQHQLQQAVMVPVWSADDRRIAYATSDSAREPGFAIRLVDALNPANGPTTLLPPHTGQLPQDFTPDGRALVIERRHPVTQRDLWLVDLEQPAVVRPLIVQPGEQRAARVSPDGRAFAYVSNESGRDEIYVRPLAASGVSTQISAGGGRDPRWGRDTREVFYRGAGGLMSAELSGDPLIVTRRRTMIAGPRFTDSTVAYDVDPVGRRFALVQRTSSEMHLIVLLNWFQHSRR
jgi:DNA-binding SARP family transcriptional activator/Tol biopolymer transport system component